MVKIRIIISLLSICALIGRAALWELAETLNGYGAKVACTLYFVQGRSLISIYSHELAWPPIGWFVHLRQVNETCIESVLWFAPFVTSRRACLHEKGRLGCALVHRGKSKHYLETDHVDTREGSGDDISDFAVRDLGSPKVRKVVKLLDDHLEDLWLNTRALIVVNASEYPARILYEKYANGFNSSIPQAGWSMAKSILSVFIASLFKTNPEIFPNRMETKIPMFNDSTTATLRHLLTMTDGQDWDEIYAPLLDPTDMLFKREEAGFVKPQRVSPGSCFQYSSKTSNLLSSYIKSRFNNDVRYLNAPYRNVIRPLNIQTCRMETDPSKVYVASSFMTMTPLDWVRVGVLLANYGRWPATGRQLLDESFMEEINKPVPTSRGLYGLHFWLGGNKHDRQADDTLDDMKCDSLYTTRRSHSRLWYQLLPKGSFFMSGFEGQYLIILPKEKLVVLRMGASREQMPFWKKFEAKDLFVPLFQALGL